MKRLHENRPFDESELASDREYFSIDQPALGGVMARAWLVEVDDRFSSLDPLVVMEEFAEASAEATGGRRGADRTGTRLGAPRRMCGALDFGCGPDEPFDAAVERARGKPPRNALPRS